MPHEMKNPSQEMPPIGVPVQCVLQFTSGKLTIEKLIHVDEDDVTWRTADDRSELNEMAADVISWTDIPKPLASAFTDMLEMTGPVSAEEIDGIRQEVEEIRRDLARNVQRSQYYADRAQHSLRILETLPSVLENLAGRMTPEPETEASDV